MFRQVKPGNAVFVGMQIAEYLHLVVVDWSYASGHFNSRKNDLFCNHFATKLYWRCTYDINIICAQKMLWAILKEFEITIDPAMLGI
jgi:hypothetical protein